MAEKRPRYFIIYGAVWVLGMPVGLGPHYTTSFARITLDGTWPPRQDVQKAVVDQFIINYPNARIIKAVVTSMCEAPSKEDLLSWTGGVEMGKEWEAHDMFGVLH